MSHDNTIIGLDVGTCNTRFVVAQINDEEKKIKILGVGQAPSTGMRKGVVADLEETIKGINQAKEIAERISGYPIDRAYIGVNGNHIMNGGTELIRGQEIDDERKNNIIAEKQTC